MAVLIEAFKTLGGRTLFLTNAAGGLHTDWTPPSLVAITDHINFAGVNPLIGRASDDRFVPMTRAYDPALLETLRGAAREAGVTLREGVYMWFNGPSFETPAEIRMAKILGADLVGMSTVPEVILARLHGLSCVAVSLVTNFAAGLSGGDPSHEETQEYAARGSAEFRRLLRGFVKAHSLMLPQEIIRAKRDGGELGATRSSPSCAGSRIRQSPKGRSRPSPWRCSSAAWTWTSASISRAR